MTNPIVTIGLSLTILQQFWSLFFDYRLFAEGVSGGRRWYCWLGWWYVPVGCQYKPLLYMAPFSRNLRCKIWLGVVSPQFGGMDGLIGDLRLVPWVARWWFPIEAPHSRRRPISHRFRSAQTCHGQTSERSDGRNWSSKRRHYALNCIGRQNGHGHWGKNDHCPLGQTFPTVR